MYPSDVCSNNHKTLYWSISQETRSKKKYDYWIFIDFIFLCALMRMFTSSSCLLAFLFLFSRWNIIFRKYFWFKAFAKASEVLFFPFRLIQEFLLVYLAIYLFVWIFVIVAMAFQYYDFAFWKKYFSDMDGQAKYIKLATLC